MTRIPIDFKNCILVSNLAAPYCPSLTPKMEQS